MKIALLNLLSIEKDNSIMIMFLIVYAVSVAVNFN